MKEKVRVLVVDDHDLIRKSIVRILDESGRVEVVAEARDGVEAIEQALATKPDIVVIDLTMPRLSGLEAIHSIRSALPRCRLLVVTMHRDEEYVVPVVRAGASGYLFKENVATELDKAIDALSRGGFYFGEQATRILAEQLARA